MQVCSEVQNVHEQVRVTTGKATQTTTMIHRLEVSPSLRMTTMKILSSILAFFSYISSELPAACIVSISCFYIFYGSVLCPLCIS